MAQNASAPSFAPLAADWWDPDGPLRPLHALQPVREQFVTAQLAAALGDLTGRTLLDVGCGGGLMAEAMARAGLRVTGVDVAPELIAVARAHAAASGLMIDYRAGPLATQQLPAFDAVLALEVIEHVATPAILVQELAARLRPGGVLILSTLNRTLAGLVLGIVAPEYLLGWLPRGTHDWRQFFRPAELARLVTACGLKPTASTGIGYDPWHGRFVLRPRDLSVNYLLVARRA